MEQVLHLLIVDADGREALASWHASRWMLPIACTPERVRAGCVVRSWLAARGLTGDIIGQWLGRVGPMVTDWLFVVHCLDPCRQLACDTALRWTSTATLASSPSCLDYQSWAVARALAQGEWPAVPGPFGVFSWASEVRAWIADVSDSRLAGSDAVVPYRTSPYEVVLGVRTNRGQVFFKGLSSDRASEARLTMQLADIAPEFFPRTIALTIRQDGSVLWLTEGCPGVTLDRQPTRANAARVAAALASAQMWVRSAVGRGAVSSLVPLDLRRVAEWSASLIEAPAFADACTGLLQAEAPSSWISFDVDPTNVLVEGDAVHFVDLDDSAFGLAPLAMATLSRRLARLGMPRDPLVFRAYERGWSPALVIGDRWHAFEVVSSVVESYLGWNRVLTKSERGEITGAVEPVRRALAVRLARLI